MGRKVAPAPKLPMTDLQYSLLEKITSRHTTGQQQSKRAKILLLASKGEAHFIIHQKLDVSVNMVKSWRNRWNEAYQETCKAETETDLLKALKLFLKDLPRPGAPNKFTEVQRKQIVALACDKPSNHELEMTDWTHEMLAITAQAKGIVDSISESQVRRILKNGAITTA
jgi:transposase